MKKPRIPIARPDIGRAERMNVNEAMRTGWITQGPFVDRAEDLLCELTGRKHAICTSSGTQALIIALMAIDPGRRPWRVSAPALTFAAVHNAIRLVGGTVQYKGCDRLSWQVPYPRGGTIVADAHIAAPCYGKVEGLDRAEFMCKGPMIEDAAESFSATLNGRAAGSFGLISCVSFYANKCVTAGEGGALLTDDQGFALRLRAIANHGIVEKGYVSIVPGLNGRMTDVQAAILVAQLERLPRMLKRRLKIMHEYITAAAPAGWMMPMQTPTETPAPWLFAGIPKDTIEVWKRCETENIECRPIFPLPRQFSPCVQLKDRLMENARKISKYGVVLPLSSALTDSEVERIVEVIRAG